MPNIIDLDARRSSGGARPDFRWPIANALTSSDALPDDKDPDGLTAVIRTVWPEATDDEIAWAMAFARGAVPAAQA